jgi:hypothetical protein
MEDSLWAMPAVNPHRAVQSFFTSSQTFDLFVCLRVWSKEPQVEFSEDSASRTLGEQAQVGFTGANLVCWVASPKGTLEAPGKCRVQGCQ